MPGSDLRPGTARSPAGVGALTEEALLVDQQRGRAVEGLVKRCLDEDAVVAAGWQEVGDGAGIYSGAADAPGCAF